MVLPSGVKPKVGYADMMSCRGMGAVMPSKKSKAVALKSGGGLYANINAKRKRIAAGSGEKMRKPGAPGAPTAKAFKQSLKTAKGK